MCYRSATSLITPLLSLLFFMHKHPALQYIYTTSPTEAKKEAKAATDDTQIRTGTSRYLGNGVCCLLHYIVADDI